MLLATGLQGCLVLPFGSVCSVKPWPLGRVGFPAMAKALCLALRKTGREFLCWGDATVSKETSEDFFVCRAEAPAVLSGLEMVPTGRHQKMEMGHSPWAGAGTELKP